MILIFNTAPNTPPDSMTQPNNGASTVSTAASKTSTDDKASISKYYTINTIS